MVDAFLEVYHVRTVHPDNAALLYDDSPRPSPCSPNGHSRLTVGIKPEMLRDHGSVPEADNPSVGRCGVRRRPHSAWFPNLVAPLDTGAFTLLCMWPVDVRTTELELQWFAPAWDGDAFPRSTRSACRSSRP